MDRNPLFVAGQIMFERLHLLGEPIEDREKIKRACEVLVPPGKEMFVVEIKIIDVVKGR